MGTYKDRVNSQHSKSWSVFGSTVIAIIIIIIIIIIINIFDVTWHS